jgi:hypothetical protein
MQLACDARLVDALACGLDFLGAFEDALSLAVWSASHGVFSRGCAPRCAALASHSPHQSSALQPGHFAEVACAPNCGGPAWHSPSRSPGSGGSAAR